jgi:hypothetical protein
VVEAHTAVTRSISRFTHLAEASWGSIADAAPLPGSARRPLAGVLAVAFVLRLGIAWVSPSIHQADEVYQVGEQATKALHGYGITSWEFENAARPALLAVLVTPIYTLNVSPATHQLLVAALFSALSLIPVWIAFTWVARLYGVNAGVLAGLMMGSWFELVYFGARPTADTFGASFLLPAIYFARPGAPARSLFTASFAAMLALGIRMQLLPAVAVLVVLTLLLHGRRRPLALTAGAAAAIVLVGVLEWAWWGAPFRGHWGYLAVEFQYRVSNAFGRQPIIFFLKQAVLIYGGALPVIAALALAGARRAPIVLVLWIALVVPFHFIEHKEYRFITGAVAPMVLLMGLGAADLLHRVLGGLSPRVLAMTTAAWLVGMVAFSLGDTFRPNWLRDRNHIWAFREIGRDPQACGVGLLSIRWWHTPGYSGLGRDVPIYELLAPEDVIQRAPAVNYILAAPKAPPPPAPFVRWREYNRPVQYLYRRSGGCVVQPSARIDRGVMPQGGQ